MALPHPQTGKDHCRYEDEPSAKGILRNFVKRTIDIADYWDAEDEVNPANNRTFGGVFHGSFMLHGSGLVQVQDTRLFRLDFQ